MGTGAGVGVVRGVVGLGVDPGGLSTHSPLAMSLERENIMLTIQRVQVQQMYTIPVISNKTMCTHKQ